MKLSNTKKFNNIDLVTGMLEEEGESEMVNAKADFTKIVSQLSHADILLGEFNIPSILIDDSNLCKKSTNSKFGFGYQKQNLISFNAFTLAISEKSKEIISVLSEYLSNADKIIEEKIGKKPEVFESSSFKLLNILNGVRNHHGNNGPILERIISMHDLDFLRFYIQRMGCNYFINTGKYIGLTVDINFSNQNVNYINI